MHINCQALKWCQFYRLSMLPNFKGAIQHLILHLSTFSLTSFVATSSTALVACPIPSHHSTALGSQLPSHWRCECETTSQIWSPWLSGELYLLLRWVAKEGEEQTAMAQKLPISHHNKHGRFWIHDRHGGFLVLSWIRSCRSFVDQSLPQLKHR